MLVDDLAGRRGGGPLGPLEQGVPWGTFDVHVKRARRPSSVKAKDMMAAAFRCVRATSDIRTAMEMLRTLDVRHLPVVDDEGVLVGILSDRELRSIRIPYFVGNEYVGDLRSALAAKVSRILSGQVPFVRVETDAVDVIDAMLRHEIGAVPVVDDDGILLGVVNYMDVLRAIGGAMEESA